jgi:hypothetical protein
MNNILEDINNLIKEEKDLKEIEDIRKDMREAWYNHFNSLGSFNWDKGIFK